jgi:hypothetical protein
MRLKKYENDEKFGINIMSKRININQKKIYQLRWLLEFLLGILYWIIWLILLSFYLKLVFLYERVLLFLLDICMLQVYLIQILELLQNEIQQ